MPYSTIHLQLETKEKLKDRKSEGQSYDGVIKEILKKQEEIEVQTV